MKRRTAALVFAMLLSGARLHAQEHQHTASMKHEQDSSFKAMNERGGKAMLVDQDKSTHLFDALPDGGRIELQANDDDPAAVAGIRQHFQDIETAFRGGNFSIPMFVHAGEVPGAKVMAEKKGLIDYMRRDLPRGAELRLRSRDAAAIAAIQEFMAFQRAEHRAGGKH